MRQIPRPRTIAAAALGVSGLIAASVVVAAATAMGVLAAVMARTIVSVPKPRSDDTRIEAVDTVAGTIRLQANSDSILPGDYGLWFSGGNGHARLGEIVASGPGTVTRRVLGVDFGDLGRARRGRLGGWLYLGPWHVGVPFENVLVPGAGGAAPAWLVPAAASAAAQGAAEEGSAEAGRWVIQVHGRGVTRHEALRAVPVFRERGYTSLLVSYRNDGEAPVSADSRYGLGDTEWRDVDAAIAFALGRGAQSVVLMGWSMGGAIVLQAAARSRHRECIVGVVLDSPVIDWADVIAAQAAALRVPASISRAALAILGHRWGGLVTGQASPIDFARLDVLGRSADLELPILLLHSDDDGYVPVTGSRALALSRPDIVTFVPFSVARHTKLWNYDRDRWNGAITAWLADLEPTARTSHPPHRATAAAD